MNDYLLALIISIINTVVVALIGDAPVATWVGVVIYFNVLTLLRVERLLKK